MECLDLEHVGSVLKGGVLRLTFKMTALEQPGI